MNKNKEAENKIVSRKNKKNKIQKFSIQEIKQKSIDEIFTNQEIEFYEQKLYESFNYNFKKFDFYNSLELYQNGMDYNNWIKLYYNISYKILGMSSEAFQLLLCLISHPHTKNKETLYTTPKFIMEKLNIEDIKHVKKCLYRLLQFKYIYTNCNINNITQNEIISVVILYNNNLIAFKSEGFKPIPVDYVNRCLLKLTPLQCSIVCILIDNFTYFTTNSFINNEGTTIFTYKDCGYAFPELETIGMWTGYDRRTIKKNIEELAKMKILSYGINGSKAHHGWKNGEKTILNPNYTYRVRLLQRIEYQYYYIYMFDQFDKRDKKEIKDIRSKLKEYLESSNYKMVKQWDYAMNRYLYKDFDNAIKQQNEQFYNTNNKTMLLAIEDFSNKNSDWNQEKEEKESN